MKRLFSPAVKKIYAKYPALIRTNSWERIVALCNKGDEETAELVARDLSSRSKQINAQNILARKIRVNRVQLFAYQSTLADELRELLQVRADSLELAVRRSAETATARDLPTLRRTVASEMAVLRRDLNTWLRDGIWQSILLGLRNTEDALVPVFKANEESYAPEIGKERELIEERLSFGLTAPLVGKGKPKLARGSTAYDKATDKLYAKIVDQGSQGLRPSDRIWQQTKQAELQMNNILQREIAAGTESRKIAQKLGDFLSPEVTNREPGLGSGVYRSPFKNAYRLARTQTNAAYTGAQAEWAKTRSWVKGIMVTLSPAHDPEGDADICDEWAGRVLSPEEFQERVPFHGHCMCFGTIVIKDEFLDTEEAVRVGA